jgi:hypothetical protein
MAIGAPDARLRSVALARLRKFLGAKDYKAGRIGPPVPKKWEKEYRGWLKTGRPVLYRFPSRGVKEKGR